MEKLFFIFAIIGGICLLTYMTAIAACPDIQLPCASMKDGKAQVNYRHELQSSPGWITVNRCWKWGALSCQFCFDLSKAARRCTDQYPNGCANNNCVVCYDLADPICINVEGKRVEKIVVK
jgi:hypothetical protein